MTFIDSIRRQLQAMSATERQRAISSLRDLIYEDAYTHAPCGNTVRDWAHVMPPYMDYCGVTA